MNAWHDNSEWRGLAILLLAALAYAIFFVFLIPPWQHYDEPTHFEHVWVIGSSRRLPEPGVYDEAFRAEMVRSMLRYDFFEGLIAPDPENLPSNVAGLQYPQLDEPSLYYLLLSPATFLLQDSELHIQLYAARLISAAMLVVVVLLAGLIARDLTGPGDPLRMLIPAIVAFIPGFVDQMTAVNNDAGAVLGMSLFMWAAVRLLTRNLHWGNVVILFAAVIPSLFMKSTAFPVVGLVPVAIGLALVRGRWRILGITLGLATVFAIALLTLSFDAPRYWYRNSDQSELARSQHPQAPQGEYVLSIQAEAPVTPEWLDPFEQPFALKTAASLAGKLVTVGAWAWADWPSDQNEGPQIQAPVLHSESFAETIAFNPSREPEFVSYEVFIPQDTVRLWLALAPRRRDRDRVVQVYYDGLVLVEGRFSAQPPAFTDSKADTVSWDGQVLLNHVRNPGFELAWLEVRHPFDSLFAQILPDSTRPNVILSGLTDPSGSWWLYRQAASNLSETFWARFGWGHVRLPLEALYNLLTVASLSGLAASAYFTVRRLTEIWPRAILLFSITASVVWGAAFVRSAIYVFMPSPFLPAARYAYPAIIPTVILFSLGWSEIIRSVLIRAKINPFAFPISVFTILGLLNIIAVYTIFSYY